MWTQQYVPRFDGVRRPHAGVTLDCRTSADRTHTELIDRLLRKRHEADVQGYSSEFLASQEYQDQQDILEIGWQHGFRTTIGLGDIKWARLLLRYTLDTPNKYIKFDALVNPTEPEDLTDRFSGLSLVAGVVAVAPVDGFIERGLGDHTGNGFR